MTLSIVTPVFNEAGNLDALYAGLATSLGRLGFLWEWVIVDDHSRDDTFAVIERLSLVDERIRGIRLARNSGSHVAISCGLHQARGEAAIVIAGDLQDPPELIGALVDAWRHGAHVVWAVRRARPHTSGALYYWIMRRLVGLGEMPVNGADCFLADRSVLDAFCECRERGVSVFALITWLGFQQAHVEYDKAARHSGRSGWTLARKLDLVIDSVVGFSDFPLRLCGYAGVALMATAVLLAIGGAAALSGVGAGLLIAVAAMVGLAGIQLCAVGVIGLYVWRALEEARRRPQYVIERRAGRRSAADTPDVDSVR